MQRTLPPANVGTESAIVWVAIIIMHMLLIFFKWQLLSSKRWVHYSDTIMSAMAFQITSLTIVYSIVYSGADQRKNQSSASMAFVRGIHRSPLNSPHKWPVTREMFPFDDVIVLIEIGGTSGRDFEDLRLPILSVHRDYTITSITHLRLKSVKFSNPPLWFTSLLVKMPSCECGRIFLMR